MSSACFSLLALSVSVLVPPSCIALTTDSVNTFQLRRRVRTNSLNNAGVGLETVCKFEALSDTTEMSTTRVTKEATSENVLFRWRDVVVVEDAGDRYLLFTREFESGVCREEALVSCGQAADVGKDQLSLLSVQNNTGATGGADDAPVVDHCMQKPCNSGAQVSLSYARSMLGGAFSHRPQAKSVAVLGLGGGMMAGWVQSSRPSVKQLDAVDFNSAVVKAARCFGLKEGGGTRLVDQDGRVFLSAQSDNTYDIVLMDVFNREDQIPGCLSTSEYFADVQRVLGEQGLLAVNVAGQADFSSVLTTIRANFKNVLLGTAKPESNRILLASNGDLTQTPISADDQVFDWLSGAEFSPAPESAESKNPRTDEQCCTNLNKASGQGC